MFDPQQKATGTGYTVTIAFVTVAIVFIPTALIFSRPVNYSSVIIASVSSAFFLSLAWIAWRKLSRLTIPSIATRREE